MSYFRFPYRIMFTKGGGYMTGTKSENTDRHQKLMLNDRKDLILDGVKDVISFDENGAVISTVFGMLVLDGEGLHAVKLDTEGGSIILSGKINGIFFSDANQKGRKKLFR